MNKVSMALLEYERIKAKNQLLEFNRKVTLLERFMSDYPNVEANKAQAFITFVNYSDLTYDEILDRIGR